MLISFSWLKEFIDLQQSPEELAELLTAAGLEVEGISRRGANLPNVVVAQILESERHPDADRLSVCKVDDGSGTSRQIVCGAKNYRVGDKVPLALPGAVLPGDFKIKVGKLRGVKSEGMMCSGRELGLSEDSEGLLILPADARVGAPISELFPEEIVFDLGATPNRPDWLSHYGIAREISVFTRQPVRFTQSAGRGFVQDHEHACIEPGAACAFYSAQRISGVRVGPSPEWMQNRLRLIGLRPINNVVDITNYVLHELGQPLHAFDAAKVHGALRVRLARVGEEFVSLDGSVIQLSGNETVIADDRSVLALAGVMGGLASGVTDSTTEVLLESAYFTSSAIRRAARSSGLQTDSSYRFERGVDPGMVLPASERAAELILQLARQEGGGVVHGKFCAGQIPPTPGIVRLRHSRCRSLLGIELRDEQIVEVLRQDGLGIVHEEPGFSEWQIPSHRADLTREADLIEEVVRIIGIAQVPGIVRGCPAERSAADAFFDAMALLRTRLVHRGFFEARTSSLIGPDLLASPHSAIALKNPLGEEHSLLRPSLLPGLRATATRNFHHGQRDVRLFEIGKIFRPEEQEEIPALGLLATGGIWSADWRLPTPPDTDFSWLRGILEDLFASPLEFRPCELADCVVGAEIFAGDQSLGFAGVLSPKIARKMDAPAPVLVAEVYPEVFLRTRTDAAASQKKFSPIPKFPSVRRDLALVVENSLPYEAIKRVLRDCREPLLRELTPFDVFRDPSGQKLPSDKKSVAVGLTFQSLERTLEASEVEAALSKLQSALEEQLGAKIRTVASS